MCPWALQVQVHPHPHTHLDLKNLLNTHDTVFVYVCKLEHDLIIHTRHRHYQRFPKKMRLSVLESKVFLVFIPSSCLICISTSFLPCSPFLFMMYLLSEASCGEHGQYQILARLNSVGLLGSWVEIWTGHCIVSL